MLKLREKASIKELEKHGFFTFEIREGQMNYYRYFPYNNRLILVNSVLREVLITKYTENDTRVSNPVKHNDKDTSTIEGVMFDLIKARIFEKVEGIF